MTTRELRWGRSSYQVSDDPKDQMKVKIGRKTASELAQYEFPGWEDDSRPSDPAHPYHVFHNAIRSGWIVVSHTLDHLYLIMHCIDNSMDIYSDRDDEGMSSAVYRNMDKVRGILAVFHSQLKKEM